jgi:putative transposase
MALSNLPRLFDAEDKKVQEARLAQQKKEDELYQEIGRLTTQLEWLKKNLASSLPRDERLSI